ncbi:MAG TPA: transglycosylase SLT domain-containing protein [Verrucomicrobiae bacterium]|nr:transglycosylase SLT domain-containing protein [Verrucomicrobiae bacterium]
MKRFCTFIAVLATVLVCVAQQNTITLDDQLLQSAEQWAKDNLDEDALRVLQSADREKVRQVLNQLQREFQGEYVVDLAGLKDTARAILPLLEQYEETYPYALWLKARLDYLDIADQYRLRIPPPVPVPGRPPKPLPNPPAATIRELWIHKIIDRPWPKSAQPYVTRLKPVFASEHVPPELVWLAEVESSFDVRARSPAGAAGLFQLMPATAKRFGLRTWPLDQRLRPEPSARASAQYLHYLHRHFRDWRLALAAYNSGEGTVEELLRRRKAHSFDAIATGLPAETQLFVPKVEATILRREGVSLQKGVSTRILH